MEGQTKHVLAVFSLMLGLSWGIPYLVSEEQKPSWWIMLAFFFLVAALIFWLWIMREQRSAEDAAEDALNAAEENLRKLEAQAAEQAARDEAEAEAEPEPVPEPEVEPAEPTDISDEVDEAVAEVTEVIEEAAEVVEETATQVAVELEADDEPDDLTRIEGIGPKYAEILTGAGVDTYAKIAAMSEDDIVELVQAGGGRRSASMATWAEQAKFAAAGDWDGLEAFQSDLSGGRR